MAFGVQVQIQSLVDKLDDRHPRAGQVTKSAGRHIQLASHQPTACCEDDHVAVAVPGPCSARLGAAAHLRGDDYGGHPPALRNPPPSIHSKTGASQIHPRTVLPFPSPQLYVVCVVCVVYSVANS
jgi:hypothetical protein